MVKRGSIADALREAAGSTRAGVLAHQVGAAAHAEQLSEAGAAVPHTGQASRIGMKAITGHFPPQVRYQLRLLAAEQDRKVEDMLAEALNRLFAAYNKPEIAPITARGKRKPVSRQPST
jgi:hypothetical protein